MENFCLDEVVELINDAVHVGSDAVHVGIGVDLDVLPL
jgi:hypothetical protein